jgi:hypothetical protein
LIDFCISRAHKTRVGSLAAFISNALAIDHDLPEPLPPYATLYRCGSNKKSSLFGNVAIVWLDKVNPNAYR